MKSNNLNPKCILTGRLPAFTATGYIVPCCWVDDPKGWKDKNIAKFYNPKLKITNNKNVENIMENKIWKDFFNLLINDSENAPKICKQFCGNEGSDINHVINRKKVQIN